MIKFKDIFKEFAQKYKFKGDLLDNINENNVEKLNNPNVNREVTYELLSGEHEAKFVKTIKVNKLYSIYSKKKGIRYYDYFLSHDKLKVHALFVYTIKSEKMVEIIIWKHPDAEQFLCKNIYLGYYFNKFDFIVSDNNISEVAFETMWSMMILASLTEKHHAAIVNDFNFGIVKELIIKNAEQIKHDNYVEPLPQPYINLGIEDDAVEKLNQIYGNVRTNRFMIYK